MTPSEAQDILYRVYYKNWDFRVYAVHNGPFYIMVTFKETDNSTGEVTAWKSRKWMLSEHMTKSEVVQTAFKAVMTAEEHETREKFTYRGKTIFGPHFDVDKLVEICDNTDRRQ
jgi:hypothetical protein